MSVKVHTCASHHPLEGFSYGQLRAIPLEQSTRADLQVLHLLWKLLPRAPDRSNTTVLSPPSLLGRVTTACQLLTLSVQCK